ncbi:MAG: hypothetical protein RRZ66_01465 [Bacteroidales bacterium]
MHQSPLLKKGTLSVAFAIIFANAIAQETVPFYYDFDYTPDSVGWQQSENKSQLFRSPLQQAGRAGISYGFAKGTLTNFNVADKETGIRAYGESYFKLSPRTMVYGLAAFSSDKERGTAGSAFLSGRTHAFNLVLMDQTNKGDRKTETYQIQGAVGHQLNNRLSVGGKFDYRGINMARTKDLRHTNQGLDLTLSPSVSLLLSDKIRTGVHYSYNRYIEGIKFNLYGTTDRQYFTLVDFGAFYGKQELFDTNGYTTKGENTPYVEQIHKAGWQLEYKPTHRLYLFNEFVWGKGDGYFGKQASAAIQYTRHEVNQWSDRLVAYYRGKRLLQQLELRIGYQRYQNYENSWRTETSGSGNSIIEYYGQNKVGERAYTNLAADYSIEWGKPEENGKWRLSLGSAFAQRELQAILYPYYRTQNLQLYRHRLGAIHQRAVGKIQLTLHGAVAFASGSGTPYTDKVFVTPSTDEGTPANADHYLMQEYNYLTARKLQPEAGFRIMMPVKKMSYYLSTTYHAEIPTGTTSVAGNRNHIHCAIGVNF